ncbi:S-adenosylmethionine synthetase [Microbulbifer donghaiensis]|uniref:dTDP-4-dehydrorhamnose reductase n=1 Tax=Microbulbifer donghaiensis TaxID=494016 RepID=A0A1M5CGI4_9GAMM|nr:SDR family oxidoreductase [Microbulbifer donghaiensis]SHF53806.1 S-adenosylmethionine synthetase [Microbulbifer donghaiensis]
MKILITGASGLLGRSVFKQLNANPAFEVTGTAYSRTGDNLLRLDLTDAAAVAEMLRKIQPQVVIHCAAERWPDRCTQNPDAAWQLNVQSTEKLAQLCRDIDAQLVYISTDYVFDGSAAPYSVDNQPNPINFYGRSKLAGEEAVLGNGDHWVLRVPLLFGPVTYLRESGVTALLETIRNPEPTALDDWAIRYPTSVEDVAQVLEQCLLKSKAGTRFAGTYHWSGDIACTRYQLAKLVAESCALTADHLSGDSAPQFNEPRPYNCQLDKSRLADMGIEAGEPLPQQLARYLQPFL